MGLKRKTSATSTKKTTKKASPKKGLTAAQQVAALIKKDTKAQFEGDVIFDPDAPLATASKWIPMPHPWQELTGVQGVPIGHITTIQGKPDTGKTTIAMHALVEAQEMGFNVVVIDTEHKFNKKRLANMGCDVTNVLFLTCYSLEEGFDAIDRTSVMFEKVNGQPTLFLWDSLGMTPTEAELKGDAYAITVASAAKVIKKNLRRQVAKIAKKDIGIVFINHVYDNINAMFGNSTKGYGGNGAYFAAVLVLEVAKIGQWHVQRNKKKVVLGLKSKVKCTKNHMSAEQGKVAEIKIGSNGIDGSGAKAMLEEESADFDNDDDFEVPDFNPSTGEITQ